MPARGRSAIVSAERYGAVVGHVRAGSPVWSVMTAGQPPTQAPLIDTLTVTSVNGVPTIASTDAVDELDGSDSLIATDGAVPEHR